MLLEQIKNTNTFRVTKIKRHSTLESAIDVFLSEIPEAKRSAYIGLIEESMKTPLFRVVLAPKTAKGKMESPKTKKKGSSNAKNKPAPA